MAADAAVRAHSGIIEMPTLIIVALLLLMTYASSHGQSKEDFERCLQAANTGNHDRAIDLCTRIINAGGIPRKDLASVLELRGSALAEKKLYDRAMKDLNQAIQADPAYAVSFNSRATIHVIMKNYDKAIADYTQALRLDPSFKFIYALRGHAYVENKDYERGIEDLNEAVRLDPKLTSAYLNRGYAFFGLSQYGKAIDDFNRAIKLDPNLAFAYNKRGKSFVNMGEIDQGIQDYSRA
ncbi:MAG TPA: tetratricopeptide repeat protein, partial [Candidatus Binatia bacterium]|nr:tetratricopeptide repeat protein [Candidatus Binatia bacterium]